MKKKTKIVIGVILAIVLVSVLTVVGFMSWLGITWTNNHEFGEYVSKEGPWGMTATWVSEDSSSYLVCKKENDNPFADVTAYFQGANGWQSYELHSIDRIVHLNTVENGTTVDSTSGRMEFDGTTFTITDMDKDIFGATEFRYTITNQKFELEDVDEKVPENLQLPFELEDIQYIAIYKKISQPKTSERIGIKDAENIKFVYDHLNGIPIFDAPDSEKAEHIQFIYDHLNGIPNDAPESEKAAPGITTYYFIFRVSNHTKVCITYYAEAAKEGLISIEVKDTYFTASDIDSIWDNIDIPIDTDKE